MQSETLAQEFARLVTEYHEGDDHTKPEAWNLLADFAVDNADAIAAALSDKQAGEVNDAAVNAAARVHDHWTGDGTVGAMNAIRNTQEIVQSYLGASRSALVAVPAVELEQRRFKLGDRVRKHSGAWWEGRVVGFYSTSQTPIGYCVQIDTVENGPVQIYPEAALELSPASPPLSREGEDSAEVDRLTRPIVGIEHRTAQEVFDIMADRIRLAAMRSGSAPAQKGRAE